MLTNDQSNVILNDGILIRITYANRLLHPVYVTGCHHENGEQVLECEKGKPSATERAKARELQWSAAKLVHCLKYEKTTRLF